MSARRLAALATLCFGLGISALASASPPTAPTNLAAVGASSTQINLSWTASTDNLQITSYVIGRCQGSGCSTYSQVGSVASGTAYTDSGLAPGTFYQYEIYATDSNGAGPNSNVASASTLPLSVSGSVSYTYDALGRLVQASVPALGIVENYTYDASGNLLSMTSAPIATLEVSGLSSPEGAPGGTVTIVGSGFSTSPSSNTVTINGVQMTVVSATSTELVVDIPAGATSGAIEVQVGSSSVTSPGVLTVTAANSAPTISSFLNSIAVTGATVTVGGTGFQTTLADNQVQVNQTAATVVAATPTSLTFVVPSFDGDTQTSATFTAMSAPITVTTPFGSATSATDLAISRYQVPTPPPIATVGGTAVTLPTPAAGAYQVLGFSATAGQPIELVASSVSTPSGDNAAVIAPNGVTVASQTFTAAGQSLQVPTPATGRYSVAVYPEGTGGSVSWSVLGAITGTLALNGSPTTETLSAPGQSVQLTFAGTQGANVTLSFTAVTVASASVVLQSPSGATALTQTLTAAGLIVSPTLPATGTYTLTITPTATSTGSFTAALTSAATTTLTPNGGAQSVTLTGTTPRTLTFDATAGQILTLAAGETSGASSTLTLAMLQPDGTTLISQNVALSTATATTVFYNTGLLTQTGTYSLTVSQSSTATNIFALTLSTPAVGSATVGTPLNLTTTLMGQGASVAFQGVAGQYVSATFTGSALCGPGTLAILGPDGTTIASGVTALISGCSEQGVLSAGPLLTTGTYTVLIEQASGQPAGSGSMTVTLLSPVTGTLTVGSTNSVVVANGQGFAETFAGTAGQTLSVTLEASGTGCPTNGTATVLDPNGVVIASTTFNGHTGSPTVCGNAILNIGPLALTGNYTVLLQQATSSAGLGSGTVSVLPALIASGSVSVGSPSNVTVTAGQGLSETVSGTAGEYLSVAISSPPGGTAPTSGTIEILSPTGVVLATATYAGTACSGTTCDGAGNINVGPLPSTGQYTIVFEQTNGLYAPPGSGSMTVTAEAASQGTLTLGTPATLTLAAGQAAQESFTGTAGQYANVSLSETASLIQSVNVVILGPSGTQVATGTLNPSCSTTCTGSLSLNIGPLPSAGTYTVLLQQGSEAYGFGAGSLTLTVSNSAPAAGSSQNLSTSTAGATKQFTFTAAANQSVELAFSNMVLTPSSVTSYTVQVLNPSGGVVTNGSCTSASTCLVPVTSIATTGTYTVTVTPGGSATMSFTASVGPLVVGTLTIGTPLNLSLSYPGESASLTFVGTAGQDLALQVSGLTSVPSGTAYTIDVYDPTNNLIAAASPTSGANLNLALLLTGTYTVSVTTSTINTPATASMQLTLQTGATGSIPSTGAGTAISTSLAGEYAYYTFSGTYGQDVTLAIANIVEAPSGAAPYIQVFSPVSGGGTWGGGCATTSCIVHIPTLPATGTYAVTLMPEAQATMSGTAYLTADVTGALTVGTPVNLTLSETGQSATLTFAVPGEAPQTLSLSVANLTTSPSSTSYKLNVASFNQTDTSIASATVTSGTTLNLPSLAPGTYVATLIPAAPATATVQVTLEPQNGGVLSTTTSGTGGTFTTPAPGENSYFTFTATAGQNLTLAFSNISFNPTTVSDFGVTVSGPGSYSATLYCYSTGASSCDMPLRNLPQTGIYTVTVTPNGAATMTYAVTLSVDVAGTLTVGTADPVPLTAMGQNAWLTFTATAGETLALYVSGITTTPANTSYTITVYNSSGTSVASGSATSGTTFNLPSLAAGTYNVLITSSAAATGSMQVTLEPQTGGTLSITSSGSGSAYSTPAPYQNAYFTFSGTTGQNLTLALSGISFVPSSVTYPTVTITGPSSYSVNGTCYNTPGSCEIPLKTLPANGTYSVVVAPTGNATMAFTATLASQYTGTLTPGTALSVPLTAMGQNAALGFTATAGQTFALYVSGITSTPASTSYSATVYNSSGTSVGTASSASSITLNLLNLAAGTYSVVITPATPATASMQVTLEPQVGGALAFSGTTNSYSSSAPGQYGYFTFSGTAGQDLGLALTGLTLSPSGQTYVLVYVYEPNGTMLTYGYCYITSPGAGCQLSLTNLPATGTYTIQVIPGASQTMSFNLTSSTDVSGSLTLNTAQNVTLVSGQNTWLTFTATAGQTVAVSASSIVTNPSGQNVTLNVYNSSGTSVGSASGTSAATVNLFGLAAGTYSVQAVPAYGASATMQVTVASQAGGALTFSGTTTNYFTTVPGQYGYFTFSGTAGQDLALAFTSLTLTPSSQQTYALVYVYQPSGSQLTYAYCYTTNPGCQLNLTNLPATGTYSVKVEPGSLQTMSFNLTPSTDVTGTLTLNTAQGETLSATGQDAWLTFSISSAQTVTVTTSSISSTPANTTYTTTVYNSSGTNMGANASTTSDVVTLTNLAAGTYNVLVSPQYPATATLQVTYQ